MNRYILYILVLVLSINMLLTNQVIAINTNGSANIVKGYDVIYYNLSRLVYRLDNMQNRTILYIGSYVVVANGSPIDTSYIVSKDIEDLIIEWGSRKGLVVHSKPARKDPWIMGALLDNVKKLIKEYGIPMRRVMVSIYDADPYLVVAYTLDRDYYSESLVNKLVDIVVEATNNISYNLTSYSLDVYVLFIVRDFRVELGIPLSNVLEDINSTFKSYGWYIRVIGAGYSGPMIGICPLNGTCSFKTVDEFREFVGSNKDLFIKLANEYRRIAGLPNNTLVTLGICGELEIDKLYEITPKPTQNPGQDTTSNKQLTTNDSEVETITNTSNEMSDNRCYVIIVLVLIIVLVVTAYLVITRYRR